MVDLATPLSTVRPLRDHALREVLNNEVHARPPEALRPPLRASHLAMLSGEGAGEQERAHIAALCARAGAVPPPPGATHHSADLGTFRLKWERHTEFSSYTVHRPGTPGEPFAETAVAALPADWLAALPGELLVGIHLALVTADDPAAAPEALKSIFGSDRYVGAGLAGGAATAWTDFRIHADGFSRILVRDQGLTPNQAGRTGQRLIEIETYRMLALLALPIARAVLPRISAVEAGLAEVTELSQKMAGIEAEQDLLDRITRLAALGEQAAAETSYRFAAARAYQGLVDQRIADLREVRIEGLQTIGEFMSRRLGPALKTCESVAARQEALSWRISRASNLLRTRVDLQLEAQNRDLLRSMDRRAQLQLRLQETVEGLSVVAISYYLIGILSYLAKALHGLGLPVEPEVAAGLAVPVVAALVWTGVRRIRRVLGGHGG